MTTTRFRGLPARDRARFGCRRCAETVSAMLDGEASAAETQFAKAHLATCPACRTAADRMTALTRNLRTRVAQRCPDLVGRVLAPPTEEGPPTHSDFSRPTPSPSCIPARTSVWLVGNANCGCAAECACGCQRGGICRCGSNVA